MNSPDGADGWSLASTIMINMAHALDMDSRFDIPLSKIDSTLIQQFHRHWLQLCSSGRLPSRADLDPCNFPRLLPSVILVDIERDPFRVRYRLCGTRVAEFCGNLTGRYLDEINTNHLWSTAAYLRQYEIVANEVRPVFSFDWMIGRSGARHPLQTGIWPLAGNSRMVDTCIAVEDYFTLVHSGLRPATLQQPY